MQVEFYFYSVVVVMKKISGSSKVKKMLLHTLAVSALTGTLCAQMITGDAIPGYYETLGLSKDSPATFKAMKIASSITDSILWPGEKLQVTLQVQNLTDKPIAADGVVEVIHFATKGIPGDIWTPKMERLAVMETLPLRVDVAASGWANFTLDLNISETKGAYALVLDLPELGRSFFGSVGRVFKPKNTMAQYPQFTTDITFPTVLHRLGIAPNRFELGYKPTTDKDFENWYQEVTKRLRDYKALGLPVSLEVGGPTFFGPTQPLGRPRPWLDDAGMMLDTKFDLAWLPSYDEDFRKFVKRLISDYGWPRGPLNAIMLWNEPWEGISISGWGADMLRYREMFQVLAEATREACREAGVTVLIGGCDSTTNTMDKLFPDESEYWYDFLDFCSIHYQGMFPAVGYKPWVKRALRTWDTESWVANTDDRVGAVVATNLALGYGRAVGVFHGNAIAGEKYWEETLYKDNEGNEIKANIINVWPVAIALSAAMEFIGERKFERLVYPNGLPWVMQFEGLRDAEGKVSPEDGTLVVVGDIGDEFGADNVWLRTARGIVEKDKKQELIDTLFTLPGDAPERAALMEKFTTGETLTGASLTLDVGSTDPQKALFALYDFYGNPCDSQDGKITIPLDGRGFFLRTTGEKGSWDALVKAVETAHIDGIEPIAIMCHDFTEPLSKSPELHITLSNVLNRSIVGKLSLAMQGVVFENPEQEIALQPHETRVVSAKIKNATPAECNTYPVNVIFDARADGKARHIEDMHVNLIAARTIRVDGSLDDWRDVLPQFVSETNTSQTVAEFAWLPFADAPKGMTQGQAQAYLAYDENYFYFAIRILDSTPHEGMPRFETRDDDEYFYPEISYIERADVQSQPSFTLPDEPFGEKIALKWPEGVRRYSYRKDPVLPMGSMPRRDNVQIAFNVIPQEDKQWLPNPPGTFPRFSTWATTDYEYALNPVAARYGGGTEVWRLQYPGMPHKHFYPRQPKSKLEGPVKDAALVIKHEGNIRTVETAIPWQEIPEVKKALDQGRTIKFGFRANDDQGRGCMELARRRSVAKMAGCGTAFLPDWGEHWDNEIEFGFESPTK